MFDKLIDVIISLGTTTLPFSVINEYDAAIVMRFGIYNRTAKPGLLWKIPFVDRVMREDGRINYGATHPRSFVTKDGQTVTISGICRYKIFDAKAAILSQQKFPNSTWDGMYEAMSSLAQANTYDVVVSDSFADLFLDEVKEYNVPYGVEVISARLQDASKARNFRILKD